MSEVKNMFSGLKADEMRNLMEPGNEVLLGVIASDKEILPLKKEVQKQMGEVKKIACKLWENLLGLESNLEQK